MKQVCKLISDGTHFTPIYKEEGVKFLSVKDVRQFKVNYDKSKYISISEAESLDRRCKPQKDDVLLTKIGATFGYASVVNSDERFQIFVSLALLRPKKEILLPEFLALYLNSNNNYLQFERVIKGAGVPDLHLEDIRKIKIPVPPIEIQQKIVEKFEKSYAEKKAKEAEAERLLASVDDLVLDALGITLPDREENTLDKRIFFTKSSEISSGRFDPHYFSPKFFGLQKILQAKNIEFVKLFSSSKKIFSGITPLSGGESYTTKELGIPFVRSGDYSIQNEIDFDDLIYLKPEIHFNLIDLLRNKLGI